MRVRSHGTGALEVHDTCRESWTPQALTQAHVLPCWLVCHLNSRCLRPGLERLWFELVGVPLHTRGWVGASDGV